MARVTSLLTRRECELLECMVEHEYTPVECGLKLGISPRTVYSHFAHIQEKLNCNSLTLIVVKYMKETRC